MEPPADVTRRSVKASRPTLVRLDRHALIQAETGVMRLEAEGQRWTLPPAHSALVAAHRDVRVSVPNRVTAVWVHFDSEVIPAPAQTLSVFEMTPLARELVSALCGGAVDLPGPAIHRMVQTLGDVTLALAARPFPCVLPAPSSDALAKAMSLADMQLENLPSFGEIARESAQSTRSLTRRCTDELGMTWRDLIRRMRMIRAVEALATTDAPVAEIAVLVGYSALSGFNDAFRDFTGLSPTAFRARGRPLV